MAGNQTKKRSFRESSIISRKGTKKEKQPRFDVNKSSPRNPPTDKENKIEPHEPLAEDIGHSTFTPQEFDIENVEGLDCFIIVDK